MLSITELVALVKDRHNGIPPYDVLVSPELYNYWKVSSRLASPTAWFGWRESNGETLLFVESEHLVGSQWCLDNEDPAKYSIYG